MVLHKHQERPGVHGKKQLGLEYPHDLTKMIYVGVSSVVSESGRPERQSTAAMKSDSVLFKEAEFPYKSHGEQRSNRKEPNGALFGFQFCWQEVALGFHVRSLRRSASTPTAGPVTSDSGRH